MIDSDSLISTTHDTCDPVLRVLGEDLDRGFAELFAAYKRPMFSAALRLSGDRADAEDLTAEAFLRAYRALCGYDGERIATLRPRAWLMTILMNHWRNTLRTASRRPVPILVDKTPETIEVRESVEDMAIRREQNSELAELLGLLPPDRRAAVVLRHVVDMPVAEIATVLGLAEGTVKSNISRGLRRLRTLANAEGVGR